MARRQRRARASLDARGEPCSGHLPHLPGARQWERCRPVLLFATKGEIRALHTFVALRRSKGRTCIESFPTDPVLEDYARNFARELEWEGLGTFAFFVTPNGDSKYMEMNGRMWGTLEGSIHAGGTCRCGNARDSADGGRSRPHQARKESRLIPAICFTWRSCSRTAIACRLSRRVTPPSRARLSRGWGPHVHSDVFRLNDPLPELVEHWNTIRPLAGRVPRCLARRLRR